MAYRDVTWSQEEDGGSFYKFDQIGQKFLGRFLSSKVERNERFNKDETRFTFKTAIIDPNTNQQVVEVVTLPSFTDLDRKLKKANLKAGWKVRITYTGEIDVGQQSKMKQFKVEVDDDIPAQQPQQGQQNQNRAPVGPPPGQQQQQNQRPPPPAFDEDIPF